MSVLVAGVGNVFLGDDGFGVAVARRLAEAVLPDGVVVGDFGIRGVHLAYELTGGAYDGAILVDAVSRGGPPGTLYVLRPEPGEAPPVFADAHDMTPDAVLALTGALGGGPGRVLVLGCEPADLSPGMDLSPPVAEAVDAAVDLVLDLVREQMGPEPRGAGRKENDHDQAFGDALGAGGGGRPRLPVDSGHQAVHADQEHVTGLACGVQASPVVQVTQRNPEK
ncbi:hydrogenase maturation protease [Sphaerisporangium album]|uniref:hydrogenase maturation protease n=1 Tax=Sphaerisporangium album TaxID=509200 RepID=UPI001C68ACBC|nr:hydrogenase maturation protease [Sphaerisporangium album]